MRKCLLAADGANCYAETLSKRNPEVLGEWGPNGLRAPAAESYWKLPYRWNRMAIKANHRPRVFCASLADVFEDNPQVARWQNRMWLTIHECMALDWLLLTKRPENFKRMVPWENGSEPRGPWPHVWLGVSVEDQKRADERLPPLLGTRAAVRFVSCEPLLESVTLMPYLAGIHWCIVGGESGARARAMALPWTQDIVNECRAMRVPVFVKQLGARPVATDDKGGDLAQLKLRDRKGGDPEEWPDSLRIREFPPAK